MTWNIEPEKKTLREFKNMIKKDDNVIFVGDLADSLKEDKFTEKFKITCLKCGSNKVEITGENAWRYSEYTSNGGELGFKCINCGSAVSCYISATD